MDQDCERSFPRLSGGRRLLVFQQLGRQGGGRRPHRCRRTRLLAELHQQQVSGICSVAAVYCRGELRWCVLYVMGNSSLASEACTSTGHYIPNLAAAIVAGNAAASAHTPEKGFLNLQGILIGNAWTDASIDNFGAAEHWYSHYMISHSTFQSMVSACNFSEVGPIKAAGRAHALLQDGVFALKPASAVDDCDVACDNAMQEMGPVNIYQLFADICVPTGTSRSNGAQLARSLAGISEPPKARALRPDAVNGVDSLAARSLARAREVVAYWAGKNQGSTPAADSSEGSGSGFPAEAPCIDDFVDMYLNRADVREALHVRPDAGVWSVCTDAIDYSTDDLCVLCSMISRRCVLVLTRALPAG